MVTLCDSSRPSRSSLANAARCVEKLVALPWPDPAVTAFLVVPVIASEVLVTLVTLPLCTCCTNTS